MAAPEYVVCINCESPCYIFEWKDDQLTEALCEVCGNEDVEEFLTSEDFDTLIGS
jgi:translation initiation factor 2 beta subunit (eIF-2beta)/eIF-5